MLEPNQFVEAFKTATSTLPGGKIPLPTSTSVSPIPTVLPGGTPVWEKIHTSGKTTLWVAFAIFLVSTIVLAFLAWRVPVQKRLFNILTTFIVAISTLAYYAQATGAGSTFIHIAYKESHKHDIPSTVEHVFRQVFWAHAVDSALTFPLVLLSLSFLAGLSGANILVIIFANFILALTTLFASFDTAGNNTKWGWFVLGLVAFFVIAYQLIVPARRAVKAKGDTASGKLFSSIAGYTLVVWLLYLVAWAVTEGTRQFSVDAEVIAYAVLDILAKPVFAFWLIFAHTNKPSVDGFWSHGLVTEGGVRLDDDEA